MIDETTDWDELTPHEKLESPRGRYLIATAFHYAVQQISRFPEVRRADRDCEGMREILNGCFPRWPSSFVPTTASGPRSTSRKRWMTASVLSGISTPTIERPGRVSTPVEDSAKGGAKDCHLGWWSDLGVRLGVGDAVRGFSAGAGSGAMQSSSGPRPPAARREAWFIGLGVGLATRASGARCRPGPGDGVPQFSYRHCFCGRGFG